MSIRIRTVGGVRVAVCAARSVEKPGDIYLDDADHYALAQKFAEDFSSEGCPRDFNRDESTLRLAEESHNPNRDWWDRTYGGEPVKAARVDVASLCKVCGGRYKSRLDGSLRRHRCEAVSRSTRRVRLLCGVVVTVTIEGPWMKSDTSEREWLGALADLLESRHSEVADEEPVSIPAVAGNV